MADTETGDDGDALDTSDDTRAAYYNDPVYMTSQAATLGLDRVQQYLLDKLRADTLDDEFEGFSNKTYIGAQGPKTTSVCDFWRMVWQEKITHIVMLTNLAEAGKSQYRFVHEAILEAYTSRHTRLVLHAFNSVFPLAIDPMKTNDRIDSEFKLLNQMKVLLHKPSHTVAEDEENIGKNRTLDILPDDSHLACLSSPVSGRNQYINAVFLSTFFSRLGCIMTQLPLYHTLVDIWRLVDGNDVTTIVSLGAEVEGLENHSYDREVYVLQYSGWTYEVPNSTPDILHLVDLVNARARRTIDDDDDDDEVDNKVIVQCL
nr:hypothetical protein BaRGS_030566 [Batillaria attramentaria]